MSRLLISLLLLALLIVAAAAVQTRSQVGVPLLLRSIAGVVTVGFFLHFTQAAASASPAATSSAAAVVPGKVGDRAHWAG